MVFPPKRFSKEADMDVQQSVMAFSQSEKIKSGLIWVSQSLEMIQSLPQPEQKGAFKVVRAMISMITHEIRLARNLAKEASWEGMEGQMDKAMVMIDSGVGSESVIHLTQALSQVTTIGQRSMSLLKERGLL